MCRAFKALVLGAACPLFHKKRGDAAADSSYSPITFQSGLLDGTCLVAFGLPILDLIMNITLKEIALAVGGTLSADAQDSVITGLASLAEARGGDLSFFYDPRYARQLSASQATAVLVPVGFTDLPAGVAGIHVAAPSQAFEKLVAKFYPPAYPFTPGIHPTAVIAESAKLDRSKVQIDAHAVIDAEVELADGVHVGAGCFVGRGARIGKDSVLNANVTVQHGSLIGERVVLHSGVVIGADGFGYEFEAGRHRKIPQVGIVQLEDDIEIGAGTMVDRARFGRTWIGSGTKIDNLVQIGHNVTIGRHCIIVAGAAIAGSATIGDYVVIAAQSGVAGHVNVGSGCTLGGRSGVTKDLPAGQVTYLGFPAQPCGRMRSVASQVLIACPGCRIASRRWKHGWRSWRSK